MAIVPVGDHREHRVLAARDVEPGEQERGLGGDRDAGALGHHQQEDPGQPHRVDHVDGELDDRVGQGCEQDRRGTARLAGPSRRATRADQLTVRAAATR